MRHLMILFRSKIKVGVIICVILKAKDLFDRGLVEDTIVSTTPDSEASVFEQLVLLVQLL